LSKSRSASRETGRAPEPAVRKPHWHALETEDVLQRARTTPRGLSQDEAARRLARVGPNRLPAGKKQSALTRFLLQFHNLLIYILLAAAVLSYLFEHAVDAVVILGVVVLNAIVGFVQEGRAEQALEAIRGMIDPDASVMRDGRRLTIPADEVAPGDIVLVEAGDRVPADLRLLRARSLKIDEAALTGESVAVDKATSPVEQDAGLGDRTSMAYSGTFVVAGQGTGIVVETGPRTELGRVSTLISSVETLETPLIRQMNGFARQLTFVILAVSLGTLAFAHFLRGYPFADAFMVVVGLAVSAIPEGLPAVMTITLAIGVQRMAARHAIIRRLPAVETLGSVSVICSDKTGTLTRNEMTARTVVTTTGTLRVTGTGYEPIGHFEFEGTRIDPTDDLVVMLLVGIALLCNDAEVRETETGWVVDGDPMEGALVTLAMKAGIPPERVRVPLPRSDEIPFDSQHKFMATLHTSLGKGAILLKGAPERLLDMCDLQREVEGNEPIDREAWQRAAHSLAAQGQRVLGFAAKAAEVGKTGVAFADLDKDVVLVGFIGFIDPPREEAIDAVAECKSAGIRIVMITGDHAETAREIGRQLGISDDPEVMAGREIDQLDADTLRRKMHDTDVFARTTPEHKLRLVQALQEDRLTVAMTGDGVNDAPALKRADVGVAMGRRGTEAAKEAAEMVLADDNFASIAAAVQEGRTVYDNITKVIAWTLPTNGGEGLTILAALALGLSLPVTPVQILWINMVTAVALGLTLAFEPMEPGTMARPPRAAGQALLTAGLVWQVCFVSVIFVCGAFGIFFLAERRGLPIEEARTLVVNTIVVMEIFYLYSVRYVPGAPVTWQSVIGTPAILIGVAITVLAQIAFTYMPGMEIYFETRPIQLVDGLAVIGVGVAMLVAVETEKRIRLAIGRARRRAA
jgi:magnesium-transporting ATPase (P-type)